MPASYLCEVGQRCRRTSPGFWPDERPNASNLRGTRSKSLRRIEREKIIFILASLVIIVIELLLIIVY
jgi:hypothetical protein